MTAETTEREPQTHLEMVFVDWLDAIRRGDLERLSRRLSPDVVHRGVRPGLMCNGRTAVIERLRRRGTSLPRLEALELIESNDRVLLSVRGEGIGEPAGEGAPRRGFAAIVFTFRDGTICEIQDYLDRDQALELISAGHSIS